MFYICVEWHAGGYVLGGVGEDEAAALADLNQNASEFPTPPPVFASVQELRNRFEEPGTLVASLYAGEDEAEYYALIEELLA